MKTLSPSERRTLRAKAHALHPVVFIGQHGLTPAVLHEIDVALLAHELIKIRVFSDDRDERAALHERICADLDAMPVQHIGKLLIVWRPAPAPEPAAGKTRGASRASAAAPAAGKKPRGNARTAATANRARKPHGAAAKIDPRRRRVVGAREAHDPAPPDPRHRAAAAPARRPPRGAGMSGRTKLTAPKSKTRRGIVPAGSTPAGSPRRRKVR